MTTAKILIVDDVRVERIQLRRLLGEFDAEIIEAADGFEALAACQQHVFALILLDVDMPGMDGYAVAARLSENPLTGTTPIIFATGSEAGELGHIRAYGSGAVDYILKPAHEVVLRSKVRVFLELYRSRQRLEQEVAERRRLEQLARKQAMHDPLTGLANRLLFNDRLAGALDRCQRRNTACALLFLDLDDFKPVNDRYGHQAGDTLLIEFSRRLLDIGRKVDTAARLGGDEFAVLIDEPLTGNDALFVAERFAGRLSEPYLLPSGHSVRIGVSIGVALFPTHGTTPDALVGAADNAMYLAKREGKGRCRLA